MAFVPGFQAEGKRLDGTVRSQNSSQRRLRHQPVRSCADNTEENSKEQYVGRTGAFRMLIGGEASGGETGEK
ncbi:hypothetical protein HC256_003700 [Beauveria bassiana]|nr:hypothetical protein HC256_003700 [Beauveria bassiana]